jgi:hypothetical protein
MSFDSLSNKTNTIDRSVPMQLKLTDMELVVTDASFPLKNNAIVKGKLHEQINQNITISLIGENPDYYFPEKNFHTDKEGAFACPIFLKRPLHLRIRLEIKL